MYDHPPGNTHSSVHMFTVMGSPGHELLRIQVFGQW